MTTRKRHERTRSRRLALQILYNGAMTGESPTAIAESGRYIDDGQDLPEYALMLIRGCESHREDLTKRIDATSDNWSVLRMPIVDQSILRIGVFEMLYVDDVPTSVAINEAVELAKIYGAQDESPRFVNGVLGKIASLIEGDEPAGALAEDDALSSIEDLDALAHTLIEGGDATQIEAVAIDDLASATDGESA